MIKNFYVAFENLLKNCVVPISCNACDERTLLKLYQTHCKKKHGLDHFVCCVFCRGKQHWLRGEKRQQGRHLYECALRFIEIYGWQEPATEESREPEHPTEESRETEHPTEESHPTEKSQEPLICSQSCFAFRPHRVESSSSTKWSSYDWNEAGIRWMEEPLFESDILNFECDVKEKMASDDKKWFALSNRLKFDPQSGLGDVHLWIKRYLYTSWMKKDDHYTWYHLCVRAGCIQSFVEAMNGLEERIVATPYWCVCDGGIGFGQPTLQAKTHHRHLIVAVKNLATFHKALQTKLEYRASGDPPEPGFKKYYAKLIKTANHFVATIAYVSSPNSKCKCKQLLNDREDDNRIFNVVVNYPSTPYRVRPRRHKGHYFIANRVIDHAVWWMLLMIPGNGMDTFAQFSIGSRSVHGLRSKRLKDNNKWFLSAADEFQIKNCVVRFDPPDLQIDVEHPIEKLDDLDSFIYWFGGKIFPLKSVVDDDMSQESYAKRHINTLLNLPCESWFPMSRKMVRHANDLLEMEQDCQRDMKARHLKEMRSLCLGHDESLKTKQDEISELKQDIEKLKIENDISELNHKNCKEQLETCKRDYDTCKRDYDMCKRELEDFRNERLLVLEKELKNANREKKRLETEMKNYNRNLAYEIAWKELENNYSIITNEKLPAIKNEMKKLNQQTSRKYQTKRQKIV